MGPLSSTASFCWADCSLKEDSNDTCLLCVAVSLHVSHDASCLQSKHTLPACIIMDIANSPQTHFEVCFIGCNVLIISMMQSSLLIPWALPK